MKIYVTCTHTIHPSPRILASSALKDLPTIIRQTPINTHMSSKASTSDPRRPDAIVEYKPEVKRIEDDDPDVPGFVAVVLAVMGLMIRNRTCVWVGMIFSVESYLNQRASEGGLMGSSTATILFSISTLIMNYLPELLALYSGAKL